MFKEANVRTSVYGGGGGMTSLCTLVYGEVYDLPMHTGVYLPVCESTACIAHWFAVCTRVCACVCGGGRGMHACVYLCMLCIRM